MSEVLTSAAPAGRVVLKMMEVDGIVSAMWYDGPGGDDNVRTRPMFEVFPAGCCRAGRYTDHEFCGESVMRVSRPMSEAELDAWVRHGAHAKVGVL